MLRRPTRKGSYFPAWPRRPEPALGLDPRVLGVDDLIKATGASGVSGSPILRLCEEIDEKVKAFLDRPIEGEWPYLWIDATYLKVRRGGRIVSVAVIIAVGVNTDGRREVLGVARTLAKKKFPVEDNAMIVGIWPQHTALAQASWTQNPDFHDTLFLGVGAGFVMYSVRRERLGF